MLVPTTLLGMTFPIAAKLYARTDSLLGTDVSAVYAFNTLGGILGSLTAGFLLVPAIGSQYTLVVAAVTSVFVGVILVFRIREATFRGTWLAGLLAALALVPAILVLPRWDPELMSSGAYKYAPYFASQLDMESVLTSGDLLFFREGTTTPVSVNRDSESTMLAVDGKIDATDSGDMLTQKMLAHLPLLFSDGPRNVSNIGLGSGVTAGAALRHPIEKLDIIEISPEVVEASHFFDHVNNHPLEDPRVELIIGDGRNHLRYTPTKYDVSISEPSNPWMSGMASLFTREFFEEVLDRLSDEGIHCQWLHSYNMSTDDLRTVIRTFRTVFPFATLWALNENDFLLLGSPAPIEVREDVVRANFDRVKSDLATVRIQDLYSVLSLFMSADEDLDRFAGEGVLNTDDFPILEFRSPMFIYANTTDENLAAIREVGRQAPVPPLVEQFMASPTAENHRRKGDMLLFAGTYEQAAREFQSAVALDYLDEEAWNGLISAARGRAVEPATEFISGMVERHPDPLVLLAAAEHYQLHQASETAAELLRRVLETDATNLAALERLSDILASEGSLELADTTAQLLALDSENARGLFHLATIRQYQSRFDEAIALIERSIVADPENMRARNLLAILYARTFQYERAESEFVQALRDDPSDTILYNNYGLFLLQRGSFEGAVEQFELSINLNPENVQGFVGIAEALRESGRPGAADDWYRKALKISPGHPVASLYVKE
jgi:tetratricopeptide (TPR) repeat protein